MKLQQIAIASLLTVAGMWGGRAIAQSTPNLIHVSTDATGNTYYMDTNQVRRNGNVVQYEIFQLRTTPREYGVISTLSTFLADCQRGYQTLIAIDGYDANDNLVIESEVAVNERESFIPAEGTTGETALQVACGLQR